MTWKYIATLAVIAQSVVSTGIVMVILYSTKGIVAERIRFAEQLRG